MDIEKIRDYCLSFAETTEEFPFDQVTLVFKVAGKMFLVLPLDAERTSISVKCDPEYAIELRENYSEIEPAFHFNKKYWNTIYISPRIKDEELKAWITHSYREVVKKLPKIKKDALLESLKK